jgi:hypothetical protein
MGQKRSRIGRWVGRDGIIKDSCNRPSGLLYIVTPKKKKLEICDEGGKRRTKQVRKDIRAAGTI